MKPCQWTTLPTTVTAVIQQAQGVDLEFRLPVAVAQAGFIYPVRHELPTFWPSHVLALRAANVDAPIAHRALPCRGYLTCALGKASRISAVISMRSGLACRRCPTGITHYKTSSRPSKLLPGRIESNPLTGLWVCVKTSRDNLKQAQSHFTQSVTKLPLAANVFRERNFSRR